MAPHPSLLPSLQDEQSAMLMLKRHTVLKQAVDDYADSIRKLSDRAQRMFTEEHPHGFVLTVPASFGVNLTRPHQNLPSPVAIARKSSGGRARWTSSTPG